MGDLLGRNKVVRRLMIRSLTILSEWGKLY